MRFNPSTNLASYHQSSPKRPCYSLYPHPYIDPTPPTIHLQCRQQWMLTRCDQQPITGRSQVSRLAHRQRVYASTPKSLKCHAEEHMYQFMSGPFTLSSVQFKLSHRAGFNFVGTTGTHIYPPFRSASDSHPNTPPPARRGSRFPLPMPPPI